MTTSSGCEIGGVMDSIYRRAYELDSSPVTRRPTPVAENQAVHPHRRQRSTRKYGEKPGTFIFLGFKHVCGVDRRSLWGARCGEPAPTVPLAVGLPSLDGFVSQKPLPHWGQKGSSKGSPKESPAQVSRKGLYQGRARRDLVGD